MTEVGTSADRANRQFSNPARSLHIVSTSCTLNVWSTSYECPRGSEEQAQTVRLLRPVALTDPMKVILLILLILSKPCTRGSLWTSYYAYCRLTPSNRPTTSPGCSISRSRR